jgi:hypothetical protein
MSLDPAETLLAIVGISSIVKEEPMPKVGVGMAEQIAAYPNKIATLARALVAGSIEQPEFPRVHDYRKTLDRMSRGLTPKELASIVGAFDQSEATLAGMFAMKVKEVFQQLKAIFPVADYNTFAGPTQLVPDSDKVWQFFLQLQVLNDPLMSVPLIAAGAILDPQVAVMKQFFPSISKSIDDSIYAASVAARAQKTSYRLPAASEMGVNTWHGLPMIETPGSTPVMPPTHKAPDLGALFKQQAAPTVNPTAHAL